MKGKEVGDVNVDDKLLDVSANSQMIKDYLVALRHNRRQWSANTKGRSEINHSNAKPHPQKGTGRARQGTIKATQYKGGATVFGPKPKFDQHVRINRKERRLAIHFLLAEKIKEGNVRVLKLETLKEAKTKQIAELLKGIGINGKKILFLSGTSVKEKESRTQFYLSMRNIPRTSFMPVEGISGYDVINTQELIVVDSALDQLMKAIGSSK
ncbi:50S ribosomal protein L4 [Simkania sp.]|uniref:50S ribosomal protein L4 n=1 Tax=Simkania sp. TaxID=34094 RepID=UPI003B51ED82